MMELIARGGTQAQIVFVLVVLGLPLLVMAGIIWYRRQHPTRAAIDAGSTAGTLGEPPLRRYEIGRDAALRAAQPASASSLGLILLGISGMIMALGLVNFLGAPGPLLVADVLRGRLELPPGQSPAQFAAFITRSLVAGSMSSMMTFPALVVAALGFGFLRSWLLGAPLDRALQTLITDIDPEQESAELQQIAEGLRAESRKRWSVTAFILGPFWYLYRSLGRRALQTFAAYLVLMLLGLGIWYFPVKFVWGDQPLQAGTAAGFFWFHLREAIVALCVIPVAFYAGIKRDT